ncbi:MAG: acyl-CoA reductase [Bacteroidales bacterium]|nr:acyl-CoA reductase [Bacteroidales bacterium]MCF8404633.1 acyl-CoA reductase [Bacteroidales bacterium]
MDTIKIIDALVKTGLYIRKELPNTGQGHSDFYPAIEKAIHTNPWFTIENINFAMAVIGNNLKEENLSKWIKPYFDKTMTDRKPKQIGVISAGNIPLVGFHDFLCVLLSGNKYLGKLSSDDNILLPELAKVLINFEPGIGERITFIDGMLKGFDAVIATGSNNTSRYFEYYFGKYPHIIRKNRNGVAVLTGEETDTELEGLGRDIFTYFGLGCRSISKIFVPEGFNFSNLLDSFAHFSEIRNHHKYMNNYDYYRSIFLINNVKHFDNGFVMIIENEAYASPPSVIYYESYTSVDALKNKFINDKELIQVIVSKEKVYKTICDFGSAQNPPLWDYSDNVDTMDFLLKL